MPRDSSRSIEYYGAALLVLLGVGVVWVALDLDVGSLRQMGAGFMPAVYGTLLVVVGVVLAASASVASRAAVPAAAAADEGHTTGPFELRGWGCIVGGVAAFVVLGRYGGLVPAAFASIFVSALGDRANTVRGAGLLAAGLTAFGVLVFHYGLGLQLPLFAWD